MNANKPKTAGRGYIWCLSVLFVDWNLFVHVLLFAYTTCLSNKCPYYLIMASLIALTLIRLFILEQTIPL